MRFIHLSNLFALCIVLVGCATEVVVPLRVDSNSGYYLVDVEFGGSTGVFLLDTGASRPVVSKLFLEEISGEAVRLEVERLPVESIGVPVQSAIESDGKITLVSPSTFSIGRAYYGSSGQFVVADLSVIDVALGRRIDGIVSSAILNVAPYTIDFPDRKLVIGRAGPITSAFGEIYFERQYPFVQVLLNGQGFRFQVDTGALQSSISFEDAISIAPPLAIEEADSYSSTTIDGPSKVDLYRTTIDLLEFSGAVLEDLPIFIQPDNIIGLDILHKGVLSVDSRRGRFDFRLE